MPYKKTANIGILGFGVEGRALLEYLQKHGYKNITICDRNPLLGEEIPAVASFRCGEDYLKGLEDFDVLFRSPGIHYQRPELKEAWEKGVKITSPTALFFERAEGEIIGVTGTKGKGTTSTLISKILEAGGFDVHLGGNIGKSPLDFIDELNDDSISVLELSSFQLQDLKDSPSIAVVLRTTSEHLDYHANLEEYWEAKAIIVRHQTPDDYLILNQDYDYAHYFASLSAACPLFVSREKEVEVGTFLRDDEIILKPQHDRYLPVCKTSEVGLIGPHNLENVMPAVIVGAIMGVDIKVMKKVIHGFKGLPHRLELAGEIDGVKYYNDSFSTTPETCIAAIKAFNQPIVLMVGGSEKDSDYRELAETIVKEINVKAVIMMGEEAAVRIEKEINEANKKATKEVLTLEKQGKKVLHRDVPLKLFPVKNFGEAFLAARAEAVEGSIVLLSPACASFEWFENYKVRGEMFREMVKKQK